MPRLGNTEMDTHSLGGTFTFTGARIANLGATEYTLATIMLDVTGSLSGLEQQLKDMLLAAVASCQKSPRSDNLLLRVCTFCTGVNGNISEVHGFKPLAEINPADYPDIQVGGMTPLYDACFSAIGATNVYAEQLSDQDFLVNAITFVITDGLDNASSASPSMVKSASAKAVSGEYLESHVSVLVGMNTDPGAKVELERFRSEGGITEFIDAGDVTKGKLAKLAAFVSQSVSSTSQALGTGGPSQNIAAVL